MGDFKKRILSALLIGPLIVILFLLLPPKFFFLLIGLAIIMAVYEFSSMARVADPFVVTFLAVLGVVPLYAGLTGAHLLWLLFSPAFYLVYKILVPDIADISVNRQIASGVSILLLSGIFLVLPLFFLYRLKVLNSFLPLILLLTIWASDTCAYLVGKTFGRQKLVPLISPKKTREGLGGAVLGALIVTLIFRQKIGIDIWQAVFLGGLVGILGQLGDILESIAKRVCDVKDSSALIPGHGGVLDRIDSFILTTPFVYHYLAGLKG